MQVRTQYLLVVDTRSCISHQTIILARSELRFLVEGVRILGHLFDFRKLEFLLALGEEVVYRLGVLRGDAVGSVS